MATGNTDTADYSLASASVSVNLTDGTASGSDGNDDLVAIENVIGGMDDDNLIGDGGREFASR